MESTDVLNALLWLWSALTSPTSTWLQTLLTGAIGAAVGSFATQSVISRHERLAEARAELSAINHAINMCFVIVNQYLGFKRQMVLPMVEAFKASLDIVEKAQLSPVGGEILFDADLKILPPVAPPIEQLERLVLEKVTMGGRGLSAAVQLGVVNQSLNAALQDRARLIQKIEESRLEAHRLVEVYLGLETKNGADTRFKDNVEAIRLYTDDGIFFAHQTIQDLRKHAVNLLRKHGRRLGSVSRSIPTFDFRNTPDGLMPPDSQYIAWLNGFQERHPWWQFWKKRPEGGH